MLGNCKVSAIAGECTLGYSAGPPFLTPKENLMSRNLIASALLFTGLCAAGAAQATAPTPKISMAHARTIALKAAPGKVISSEYEKEAGGGRYSFDIQQKGHVQEIGVDGKSGKIVENKSEGKVDRDKTK
jgi:uncharacterized membrane protein YkoI